MIRIQVHAGACPEFFNCVGETYSKSLHEPKHETSANSIFPKRRCLSFDGYDLASRLGPGFAIGGGHCLFVRGQQRVRAETLGSK